MSNEAKNTTPKSSTPVVENPFQSFPAFDPMAMWAQGQAQMQKLMGDATSRWQSFAEQYAQIEQQVTAHAQTTVTNWAQLAKDAIAYGVQLSAEARKLSVETAKKLGIQA
ncbi:MAG: hypothetical protein ACKV2T_34545 [Kofleriaceae bacterium]